MYKLLEIFGRAITVDTADLIWHWLNAVQRKEEFSTDRIELNELDEVIELMGNMELEKASEKLKFYLFENPECVFGRMAAVSLCLHENYVNDALEQLQSIYMRQPSNTMALYTMGYCHERLGNTAQAVEFYQDCLKFKSHLQLPRQRLAAVYMRSSRVDRAIQEYEYLTTEHPEDISSLVLLGYLYVAAGSYVQAVDTFNTAIIAHPDNFHDDNPNDEIQQLAEAGDFERALELLREMTERLGDLPDLNVRMGDILSASGRPGEAISYYENALRIQPNYLEANIKLGTHYLRFGKQQLAAAQFNRAMEVNDEIVDAYIGLAIAQAKAEEEDEAYTTISLASAIQQNSTLLFSQTAMLHLQTALAEEFTGYDDSELGSTPQKADDLLDDIIKAHEVQISATPKSPDIHYKYGLLMLIKGDVPHAVEAFEKALAINPTHHRVRSKIAMCLYEMGQCKVAIKKLLETEKLEAELLQLHYNTAILYCDKRRFAKALSALESNMKANFTEPDALLNIEVVLENLGLIDRVPATWDRLTEAAKKVADMKMQ